jgi:hypothetical protein
VQNLSLSFSFLSSISISILLPFLYLSITPRLIRSSVLPFLFFVLLNLTHNASFSHVSRGKSFPFFWATDISRHASQQHLLNYSSSSRALLLLAPLPPEFPALLSADGTPLRVVRRRSKAQSLVSIWVSHEGNLEYISSMQLSNDIDDRYYQLRCCHHGGQDPQDY